MQQDTAALLHNEADGMRAAQRRWLSMFRGTAPWQGESLLLPGAVASETARLMTVELTATLSGGEKADYLKNQLAPALARMRREVEYAAALGAMVMKPYVDGKNIGVDFIQPQNFIPLQTDGHGNITEAVFVQQLHVQRRWYTRLEQHTLNDTEYTITNRAYSSTVQGNLGTPVPLSTLPQWAALSPSYAFRLADGSAPQQMLFAVFNMPFANQVDAASPLGVSVFSRAEGLMEQADKQYERILWEYEGSELAVDASVGALQADDDGFMLPHAKRRLFRQLALDGGAGGDLYSVYSPAIRDASLFHGLDELLRRIEFNCYLSYGTLSNVQGQEKTAEEIKMSRQRSYSAVCDMQKSLGNALQQLVRAMELLADLYKLAPQGTVQAVFNFGDGVTQDTDAQREQARMDIAAGVAQPWEYRVRFYGESEETAKAALANAKANKETNQ